AFALDPNANVMSQEGWEALPALLAGFSSGKASSAQVNKAIRQATTIAALVGQFIANSGVDALDNGDVSGLVTKFTSALKTNLTLG
ncbi:phage tail protein, partial [Escherichia coli]|nr:phage tail protein [Escherichia coli]